jgi:hypothetical protein
LKGIEEENLFRDIELKAPINLYDTLEVAEIAQENI